MRQTQEAATITWHDLGRILDALERRGMVLEHLIDEQRDVVRAAIPLAMSDWLR